MTEIKFITAVSDLNNPGLAKLKQSLDNFRYDYLILEDKNIQWNWAGLESIYNWCESDQSKGYTHFLYSDGFDTLALSGMNEVKEKYKETDKMLFSAEKHCFPRQDWKDRHPAGKGLWQYLNHGQFISPIKTFLKLYKGMFDKDFTCQEYAMNLFLEGSTEIELDYNCEIFQPIGHSEITEWQLWDDRLVNKVTKTKPIFFHGNGRTNMDWVYKIADI